MKRRSVALVLTALTLGVQVFIAQASTLQTLFFHAATAVSNVDQAAAGQALGNEPFMDGAAPTGSNPKIAVSSLGQGDSRGATTSYFSTTSAGQVVGNATAVFWARTGAATNFRVNLFSEGVGVVAASVVTAPALGNDPQRIEANFTNLNFSAPSGFVLIINSYSTTESALSQGKVGRSDGEIFFDSADYPSSFTFSTDPLPSGVNPPGFMNYASPIDASGFALIPVGLESSIGVNPATDAVMVQNGFASLKVTFDDTKTPPLASWKNVAHPATRVFTSDPILWTDQTTGRTFVAQLAGPTSILTITDNDGASWTVPEPPNSAPSIDHETIGGGPWASPVPATARYPHAIYYCAQGAAEASCARSDDGGLTWGPPIPNNTGQCGGLHGHVAVGPDGSVYIPNRSCTGRQGMFVSRDNGLTWSLIKVPGTVNGISDPKITFDNSGRLYFAASSGPSSGRKAVVTTSPDGGITWTPAINVGASLGILNAEQPAIIAGDAGRAAAFFYGSTTGGSDQSTTFAGVWHVYVASTFDSGLTWSLVDATPTDPVQRGYMCLSGTTCAAGRNLLDFQDMTVDGQGRVLVSYADGCTSKGDCASASGTASQSTDQLLTIARQTTGKRLYAAFDPAP